MQILLGVVSIAIGLTLSIGMIYYTVIASYRLATWISTKRMAELHKCLDVQFNGHIINLLDISFTLMFTLGITLVELKILVGVLSLIEQLVHN